MRIDESLGCLTGPETEALAAADIQLMSHFDAVAIPAPFVEFALGDRYTAPGYWRDARLRDADRAALARRAGPRASRPMRGSRRRSCATPCPSRSTPAGVNPEFFSARVGCKVSQGALNFADLGALCLRD